MLLCLCVREALFSQQVFGARIGPRRLFFQRGFRVGHSGRRRRHAHMFLSAPRFQVGHSDRRRRHAEAYLLSAPFLRLPSFCRVRHRTHARMYPSEHHRHAPCLVALTDSRGCRSSSCGCARNAAWQPRTPNAKGWPHSSHPSTPPCKQNAPVIHLVAFREFVRVPRYSS